MEIFKLSFTFYVKSTVAYQELHIEAQDFNRIFSFILDLEALHFHSG